MKRRARAAAFALAAVLAALFAAPASGVGPEEGAWAKVELDLKTNNDLHAHLESFEDGTVTLKLWRRTQLVEYTVTGKATATGLQVRFGQLGRIDVAFSPTETLSSTEPGEGCTGAPRTLREGVFTGTIEFSGERGYVRLEGPQATGSIAVISQWTCPEAEREAEEAPFARAARAPAKARGPRSEGEAATLSAYGLRCGCVFNAGVHHRHSGGKSLFVGYVVEKLAGMEIFRATEVRGPASAFDFDFAAGTATLRPPRPFRGSATLERSPPGNRSFWHSTIRVPLLGAAPIDTGDGGFAIDLDPEYQFS